MMLTRFSLHPSRCVSLSLALIHYLFRVPISQFKQELLDEFVLEGEYSDEDKEGDSSDSQNVRVLPLIHHQIGLHSFCLLF